MSSVWCTSTASTAERPSRGCCCTRSPRGAWPPTPGRAAGRSLRALLARVRGRSSTGVRMGALAALVACGASVRHPPYVAQQTSALTPIDLPPPPGRVEVIPERPEGRTRGSIAGEWVLRHGRWMWLLGRWVEVPPGARYAPWVTVRGPDGTLYYAPSLWVDDAGAPKGSRPRRSPWPRPRARPCSRRAGELGQDRAEPRERPAAARRRGIRRRGRGERALGPRRGGPVALPLERLAERAHACRAALPNRSA